MKSLSLVPKGSLQHRRFILAANENEFWTGHGWSMNEDDAMLISDPRTIDLKEIINPNGTPRKFVAPVEVEVFGDDPVDLIGLQVFMMKAARLYLDYNQNNTQNFALLGIDWSELKEVS